MPSLSLIPIELFNDILARCQVNSLTSGTATIFTGVTSPKKDASSTYHDAHVALGSKLAATFPFLTTNKWIFSSSMQLCLEACTPLFAAEKDVLSFVDNCKIIDFDATTRVNKIALDLTSQDARSASELVNAAAAAFPSLNGLEVRIKVPTWDFAVNFPVFPAEMRETRAAALDALLPVFTDVFVFSELSFKAITVRDLELEKKEREVKRVGVPTPKALYEVHNGSCALKAFVAMLRESGEDLIDGDWSML